MSTKTITIKTEAYERLKKLKRDRSFSEVILDVTKDKKIDLMESFGSLSEKEAANAKDKIEKFREDFDKDADEALRT